MSSSDFLDYLDEKQIVFKEREADLLKVMHRLRQLGIVHDVTLAPEKMQWPTARPTSDPTEQNMTCADGQDSLSTTKTGVANAILEVNGLVEPDLDDYGLSESTRQLIRMHEEGIDLVRVMEPQVKLTPSPRLPAPAAGLRSVSRLPVSVSKNRVRLVPSSKHLPTTKTPKFEIEESYCSPMLSLSQKYSEDWGDSAELRTPKRVLIKDRSNKVTGLAVPKRQLLIKESSVTKSVGVKPLAVPQVTFTATTALRFGQEASPDEPILSSLGSEMKGQKADDVYEMECPESPELSEATRMLLLSDD